MKLKGKKVLLRVDLNATIINGRIMDSDKIEVHGKTIKSLIRQKAKVVVLAHQGFPGDKNFTSLKQHARILNKYVKIKFVDDTIGKKAVSSINKLKNGQALLLENVRFLKDEFTPSNIKSNKFVKTLKPLFELYINDAFSVCHRNQTSIVSFPKVLKSEMGSNLKEELKNVKKLKSKIRSALFILGGVKAKDLMSLIKHKSLVSGELGSLALIALGSKLGKEKERWEHDLKLVKKIKKHIKKMTVPVDVAIQIRGKRKEILIKDFPQNYEIYDIGKKTIDLYKREIMKLGPREAVFFKGAIGRFEDRKFAFGMREILKEIAKSKAFSVIAGGQSSDALKKFKINKKKFGYVSLSGGALVHYLAGEKLVGLTALQ